MNYQLSIHEKINIKFNSPRELKSTLSNRYSRQLQTKELWSVKGWNEKDALWSAPLSTADRDSERKIDSRFNEQGQLTHKWLINHPEVHDKIFLM